MGCIESRGWGHLFWGGVAEFDSRLVGVNPETAGVIAAEGCLGPDVTLGRGRGFSPGWGEALPPGRLPAGSSAAEARQGPSLTSHLLGRESVRPSGRCLETLSDMLSFQPPGPSPVLSPPQVLRE